MNLPTVFGGRGEGCAVCREALPAEQSLTLPDGSQLRTQQCEHCGKVWAFQELTIDQRVILDTQAEMAQMLSTLAAAITADTGAADYAAVMAEITTRYGQDVADALRLALQGVHHAVRRGQLAHTQHHRKDPTTAAATSRRRYRIRRRRVLK